MQKLSGTLKQLPFAEVLLEVAEKQGTGLLVFSHKRNKVEIDWSNGRIIHVVQRPSPVAGNLGDMLVEIGEITTNQLTQAINQQRRSLSPLGQILIKLFGCDPRKIRQALRVQAIETLYDMFSWKHGDFTFTHGIVDRKSTNSFDPIDPKVFLREAIPALDVWSKVISTLKSPYLRIQSVGESLPNVGEFSRNEEILFAELQHKEQTFRELSITSGMGQFVVGHCLLHLLEERLIFLREPEKSGIVWSRLLLGGSAMDFAVWVLAMTLLVGAGTYLLAFAPYSPLRMIQPRYHYTLANPHWPQKVNEWRFRRIRNALEMYRTQHGTYPVSLRVLQKDGWVPEGLLYSPKGEPYSYHKRGKSSYRLRVEKQ